MFTFKGERYYNDYTRQGWQKSFNSLEEFFNWAKEISSNFSNKYNNWFPSFNGGSVNRITVDDERSCGYEFFIYQIETENGIVFSTGRLTGGKSFCAQRIKEWCEESMKRMRDIQNTPNFVEC